MADDIDPSSIPFLLGKQDTVVDQNGKPTTVFEDWVGGLWSWMKRSVVDLTTKVTTLVTDVGDMSARIDEEATIRETEDGILASQITSVEAKADAATATGEVYLAAKAGPTGTTAAYGWYLTAGNAFAGMEAMALSGGGSAIGFAANQFQFTDSGTATPVFNYSSGVWVFNVPVVIQTGSSGARIVITDQRIEVYDSSNVLRVRLGIWT